MKTSQIILSLAIYATFSSACLGPGLNKERSSNVDQSFSQSSSPDFMYRGWDKDNLIFWGLGFDGHNATGRQSERADSSIHLMLDKWRGPMTLVQFDKDGQIPRDPTLFYAPSISEWDEGKPLKQGAEYMFGCDDRALFEAQDSFNENCYYDKICRERAEVYVIWGTMNRMNFAKDGVMAYACGMVAIQKDKCKTEDCDGKNLRFLQVNTDKYISEHGQGYLKSMGVFHSVSEIPRIMQNYASATHQKLTLPDGTLTK